MPRNRRTFLATLGLAALGTASGWRVARANAAPRPLARIGLQLYTVRGEMERDLPGTLARAAGIDYKEVEFAGYFGRSPREICEILSRNGLAAPSTYISFAALGAAWRQTLDDANTVDHQWVTIPWIPELDYLARVPKRVSMLHVKDSAGAPRHRMVEVGRGTIDFRRILAASETAGVEHYFVEHDQPADPMASARTSYAYLHGLEC